TEEIKLHPKYFGINSNTKDGPEQYDGINCI
ncbi:MAG: hypothetical protein ACI96G_001068, partial [Flavobacterium sp.]